MNLPNKLTVARCLLALLFVGLMSFENVVCYLLAFIIFVAAAITDYLDGRIAREWNLVTNFGKLLDPVADKVLMLAALVMLMTIPDLLIPGWTVVVIFAREFLITGARSLAAAEGLVLAANKWGKAKTVLQMFYVITFLFLAFALELIEAWPALAETIPAEAALYQRMVGETSRVAIVLVAAYTVYSGLQFARANWKSLSLDQTS